MARNLPGKPGSFIGASIQKDKMIEVLNSEKYTYRVFWSEEDQSYIATTEEHPNLSYCEDDFYSAFLGLLEVMDFSLSEDVKVDQGIKELKGHQGKQEKSYTADELFKELDI